MWVMKCTRICECNTLEHVRSKLRKFPGNKKCFCPTPRPACCNKKVWMQKLEILNLESLEIWSLPVNLGSPAKVIPGRPGGCTLHQDNSTEISNQPQVRFEAQPIKMLNKIHGGLIIWMLAYLSCTGSGQYQQEGRRIGQALLAGLSRRDQRPPTANPTPIPTPIPTIPIRGGSHCWRDYLTESKRPPTLVPNPVEAIFYHRQMTQHLLTQFCTSLTVLRIGQFRRNPFSEKLFLK